MPPQRAKAQEKRLVWDNVFPAPTAQRYMLLTETEFVIDGMKKLCDAGRAETAYVILEAFAGKQLPILPSHPDFLPESCAVYKASDIVDYEDSGFFIAFMGFSGRSVQTEFTCLFMDDVNYYSRVCTRSEVERVWRVLQQTLETLGSMGAQLPG